MGDETGGSMPLEGQVEDLPELKERVDREAAITFGRHDLVNSDGSRDTDRIAAMLLPYVSAATVEKPSERDSVGFTGDDVMAHFFPEVVGPSAWTEQDDPEFAEGVYRSVQASVMRVLSTEADGKVQQLLNGGENGLVLCQQPARNGAPRRFYVTRDKRCIHDDATAPAMDKVRKAMRRAAALTALAIARVPEHGRYFASDHQSTTKTLMVTASDTVRGALEASTADDVPADMAGAA